MKGNLKSAKSLLVILVLITVFTVPVSARSGTITLLTVADRGDELFGGTAVLVLDIMPGTGRIFIDSLPLSRLDTQISIRLGKEVACQFVDKDCTKYDFFYTIRADSSLVKGPSAGAAVTVLTASLLGNYKLRDDIVVTGTINSGGLIGPVSGISEKAEAARKAGFNRILVPMFELPQLKVDESGITTVNESVDDKDVQGIEIIRIASLDDALFYFAGSRLGNASDEAIPVPREYSLRMAELAGELCNRGLKLNATLSSMFPEPHNETYTARLNSTGERFNSAMLAIARGDFYSAASYCFSSNLVLRQLQLSNMTESQIEQTRTTVISGINELNVLINSHELSTLSDLETYMIVMERLTEATNAITNASEMTTDDLAYALERFHSAVSWAKLFGLPGRPLKLEEGHLKHACIQKISEAEERFNLVELYLSGITLNNKESLDMARADLARGSYESCLFRASKSKGEANIVLSSITIPRDQMEEFIDSKLYQTKKVIFRQQSKGLFPILGYSYYEYANSLKENDPFSALTFSEYALEISNLDMYFPRKGGFGLADFDIKRDVLLSYSYGLAIGFILALVLMGVTYKRLRKRMK